MKKIKIAIVGIIFIIVSLIILIVSINKGKLNNENSNTNIYEDNQEYGDDYTYEPNSPVEDANIFYSVSYGIEKYFDNLYINKNKVELYQVLDKRYIEENNITQDNILELQEESSEPLKFTATQMNLLTGERYQLYAVKGFLQISETKQYLKDCYFIVTIDSKNTTYAIYPVTSKSIKSLSDINLSNEKNLEPIQKNDNNEFTIISVDKADLVSRYISYYKDMALYNPESAYELLDKEYREKRFTDLNGFKEFVNANKEKINNITLNKYRADYYDGYTEYIALDTLDNYYIFKETSTMQFSLILDTYTIDAPEFIKRYNEGDKQVKVGMNIEKVIYALNDKNYNYVYEKLDESFRKNNFNNVEQFSSYVSNNLYNNNEVEYVNFSEEGEVNIYQLKVKEYGDESNNTKELTIIMKLLEGTNFVLSFSIE